MMEAIQAKDIEFPTSVIFFSTNISVFPIFGFFTYLSWNPIIWVLIYSYPRFLQMQILYFIWFFIKKKLFCLTLKASLQLHFKIGV